MILQFIILALSVPVGFLIAWLARDELRQGRKYIQALTVLAMTGAVGSYSEAFVLSFGFIALVSFVSLMKSYDLKWAIARKV